MDRARDGEHDEHDDRSRQELADRARDGEHDDQQRELRRQVLAADADELDSLADTAELMGDDDGAARFRAAASQCRLRAMALLDG